ncbi:MAG: YodC family protein [Bacteroidia bacterium]
MPQKFKTGDQVMLKSGGPKMTESIYQGSESTNVLCVWFAGEEVKTAYFHEDTIKNQAEGESGFLMSDAAKEEAVIDKDMLYRMQEVQKLPDSDKDKITSIIDAFIRDTKAKQSFRIS